jgi:hypothetical protein
VRSAAADGGRAESAGTPGRAADEPPDGGQADLPDAGLDDPVDDPLEDRLEDRLDARLAGPALAAWASAALFLGRPVWGGRSGAG